jgi:amidophosphoribosyltransferase
VTSPDGHLDSEDRPPREACGVFGVWAPGEDVAKLAYFGLYALQHRGQESAGIAVSDGHRIMVHKEMGLVAQVFDEPSLTALRGHIAVGHCRYSTTGASVWANAQPTFRSTPTTSLALGHNGNLINTAELAALLDPATPDDGGIAATSDTDVLTALFVSERVPSATAAAAGAAGAAGEPASIEDVAAAVLPLAKGAYSLVFMDVRPAAAPRVPVRVRLPGPAGHHDLRARSARHPRRRRPAAGGRAPRPGRPGHPGP